MGVGGTLEHRADQPRFETIEKVHGVPCGFATCVQRVRLFVGAEQALVLAQRFLDFPVAWQEAFVADTDVLGRLAFGHPEIANAVFADQARGFEGDAATQLMTAPFGMDTVVSGGLVHGETPVAALGPVSQKADTKSKGVRRAKKPKPRGLRAKRLLVRSQAMDGRSGVTWPERPPSEPHMGRGSDQGRSLKYVVSRRLVLLVLGFVAQAVEILDLEHLARGVG